MPDIVQNVIVDFQVDYSQLTGAQEQLAKSGKIDDKGFRAIQAAIDTTATDSKGLIKTFKDVATASTKMGKSVEDAFASGITDALDEAGVSLDQFNSALKKANTPAITLKKELQQLKERMAQLKAAGQDTGKEFDALRQRAGKLSDAIADANSEIKNAGSDTRGLDNVVGSISALAGGYAAVQGAAALFGDENEDLQKTLVKVNGAMAIATGLQQLSTAVQKEGALAKLADSVATGAQTAAQRIYAVAVGTSTGAMKAFRVALLATGIGAIVAVLVLAADAMGLFGSETAKASTRAEDLADNVAKLNKELDNASLKLDQQSKLQIESLKQRGASERELSEEGIRNLSLQNRILSKGIEDRIKLLGQQGVVQNKFDAETLLAITQKQSATGKASDFNQKVLDQEVKTLQEIVDAYKQIEANLFSITLTSEQLKTKVAEDAAKKLRELQEKQAKAAKEAAAKAKEQELGSIKETVLANLAKVQKVIEQEQIGFDNQQEINAQKIEADKALSDEFDKLDKERQASFKKTSEQAAIDFKEAEEKKRAEMIKTAETIIEIAGRVNSIFSALAALQSERDNQFVQGKRKEVDEQLKAGVITQKAAEARQKQIDQFERAAKRRAAERDKQAAVFTALLAIPQAFLAGLKTNVYVAAIYAALAAVQAAIIIARPVPKFFRGKKDSYEGPGQVADMGSEIVERNGRMFLYTKPTETYLGARDKVYTAAETSRMLHNTNLETTIHRPAAERFDYDRFAKAIPAAGININIDKDGITEWTTRDLARKTYLDRRYSSK